MVQLLLLVAFVIFGYFGFSAARKSEQNRVWAGMAKETAHQLGTPISAIIGWIEHLKMTSEDNEENLEIVAELRKDVERLELIADRFSKIGSDPVLESVNILDQLEQIKTYMQRRSPRNIQYDFPDSEGTPVYGQINPHLFTWVLENLIRNALDAMGPKGIIKAELTANQNSISIHLSDTGKGIPANQLKKVFQPGFSTKKRGWGLGLSLAKRIIENYHRGKIFVKQSKPDEGTTFTIKLPKKK
jgi:signal transduction histidine kinase